MKILIVEDEPIEGIYAETIVKKIGFDVAGVVDSAAEAVEYIQHHPVDFLILDINLKGREDGIDAAQRVKSIKNIPVIYVTAYPDSETLNRALETEPHAYLIKPFNKMEMNVAIRLALRKHELETNLLESQKALRRLNRKQEEARELERKHIAQEVHDAIGQELIGVKLALEQIAKLDNIDTSNNKETLHSKTTLLYGAVDRMIDNAEKLTGQLRPPFIDELGIIGSIGKEVNRLNSVCDDITIKFKFVGADLNMDKNLQLPFYRIFQEAISNALKHARPTCIDVQLINEGQTVSLIVSDDGVGFDVDQQNSTYEKGMGLIGMREKTQGFGGDFAISSSLGSGTTITVNMPLQEIYDL